MDTPPNALANFSCFSLVSAKKVGTPPPFTDVSSSATIARAYSRYQDITNYAKLKHGDNN